MNLCSRLSRLERRQQWCDEDDVAELTRQKAQEAGFDTEGIERAVAEARSLNRRLAGLSRAERRRLLEAEADAVGCGAQVRAILNGG